MNCVGVFYKYRFWFYRSRVGLKILHFWKPPRWYWCWCCWLIFTFRAAKLKVYTPPHPQNKKERKKETNPKQLQPSEENFGKRNPMKFQTENAYLKINNQGNRFVSIASSINVYDTEKFLHKGGRREMSQFTGVSYF